ncbi:class I tRNA ligase family protein, partial [Candidatus Gracilibacteria bacterium]|nr:class I tRNA ligase family protein [Candidatus Gracilibacteria bacterium]
VDFQLAKKVGLCISEAMDEAGRYTAQIFDYVGTHYLDLENPENGANKINIERMKANNTLFKLEGITHRVPFCPRSGTPLMQKAQDSWFIDIQSQKDKLIEANEQINWFPEYLKEGIFKKGIETAPDWCISRTRYWGAPMPVWIGEDGEQLVVASRAEIFEYNQAFDQLEKREVEGKTVYFFKGGEYNGTEFNLHKPYIDAIKLKSPKTGNTLTRIPEVLDVWMDSGSMPYAQMHYPFENKEAMLSSFPADFIAEYVGQIRAWFYVMHVLGVLLNPTGQAKPTPSFTNVITTGVVNGNDGRKMSKSFGNYPDPRMAIEKYGADPIRFYMLNSPLLSGGDMDFKEEGIMETIKGVMLPIWNTYSFFTTYANIDKWEKDSTEVWFSRHAESTSNLAGKMSDGTDNPELTDKGREQAKNAGKSLREQGKNFDIIIHTGLVRTIETAQIIGSETNFTGEYISHLGFIEQAAGEYADKTLEEIATMHDIDRTDHATLRKYYKNNTTENIKQFEERILNSYKEILETYKNKKILIIGHSGTSRPVLEHYCGRSRDDAEYNIRIMNADPFRLMTTPIINPLDSWILSKLQVLIGQVHNAMDGYDVSRGCRAIVEYMDELTNWYVRLSRRRFWESGMTADKASAYETLHTVLVEVSKLLAPFMPFISENIYQGLTGCESVHLEYVTSVNKHLIANNLNRDMEICEHIVSLGLALRSRKNIRVRQPLSTITITQELDEYYQTIIRDELNVKEIRFENPEKLAKKICKPDARKIGPKYGKDVQKVITEAKNGNFVEKENGIIDVGGFILEAGEYTMEYLPLEGTLDVEGGYGMVVGLDTNITEILKTEGYARDLIRIIQDMRKEADYNVTDRIKLSITSEGNGTIVDTFGEMISSETLSTFTEIDEADLSKTESLDENISVIIKIVR